MPKLHHACSACGFRGDGRPLWGRYGYVGPNGIVGLRHRPVWCADCDGLVVAEDLPEAGRGAALEARFRALERQRASAIVARRTRPSWLARLLGLTKRPTDEAAGIERSLRALNEQINEEGTLTTLLRDRRSPPRCLHCGSIQWQPLPSTPMPGANEPQADWLGTGFRHPGCGGELRVEPSGLRWMTEIRERLYDTEGRYLGPPARAQAPWGTRDPQ